MESPLDVNLLNPDNALAVNNPAARVFKDDLAQFGKPKDFPYVATTYRLTEHFHYWTKHTKTSAMLQPQQFVEISENLAKEKGIALGDRVKVTSGRGYITAVAVVTQADQHRDVQRPDGPHRRTAEPLGLLGRRAAGLSRSTR